MAPLFDTRPYAAADLDYVNDLTELNMGRYFQLYNVEWDRAEFGRTLDKGICRIVICNNKDSGFYHFEIRDGFAKLNIIELEPAYQGKGIGTALMKAIEAEVSQMGINEIRLSVYPANPALKLYVRLGYSISKEEYSKIRMIKML